MLSYVNTDQFLKRLTVSKKDQKFLKLIVPKKTNSPADLFKPQSY